MFSFLQPKKATVENSIKQSPKLDWTFRSDSVAFTEGFTGLCELSLLIATFNVYHLEVF